MNRFERVIQILDDAVGGPKVPVNPPHFAFWRGVTRDMFVAKKVLGMPLIAIGDGASSILTRAIKGETPFGADIGNQEADFNRMPSGLPPVASEDISFIEKWIDDGCPEDQVATVGPLSWRRTNAPLASSRTDDIWFLDPMTGWAVNSDGKIVKTIDGGASWIVQHTSPLTYFRCVGFANASAGWVGALTQARRLFHTIDGGAHWTLVMPLPADAPVKICGLSVVSDQVVYCSGTNDPRDVPRMMKTTDGGASWTAWDMSAHASVLIDCYFSDPLHGWVVGGKANEPTPTTRDKLKPVVLETADGGATWINRLAGDEASFPLGEWGWKIQFLDEKLGFVSLENFNAAAILKSTDGGQSWTRLKVNDPQGNVNLEGVGFIDDQRGWVGGWGPGGFGGSGDPLGSSSATNDGGATWTDASDIGKYINRFRFFGQPVRVGYAAGDSVYKYSSDPVPTQLGVIDSARSALPQVYIAGQIGNVLIKVHAPAGTKRLTLHVWTRFGEDIGSIWDEVHPESGLRTIFWDATDVNGRKLPTGDYLIRLIADDVVASSRVHIAPEVPATAALSMPLKSRPTLPLARQSKFATLAELINVPTHDLDWLHDALQAAIQLELFTLPPYLTARWSIVSSSEPASATIKEIAREEMLHLGLVCNMLTAIGGTPLLADPAVVSQYPGPLPWGIRPGLVVSLRRLDQAQTGVFMQIEHPQHDPLALAANANPTTIGEFYAAILAAFWNLNPPLSASRQLDGPLTLFSTDSLETVERAISLISQQGEGSSTSPEEAPGQLAHYYQFGEIFHGHRLIPNSSGGWSYSGAVVPMPQVHNMADIPAGGYQQADVPDRDVWELTERFDRQYSEMLRQLQQAWANGDVGTLWASVGLMGQMQSTARMLVTKNRPDGQGTYGPCFRYGAK